MTGLEFPAVVCTPLRHMVVGPLIALGTFWLRPAQASLGAASTVLLLMIASFVAFWWMLARAKPVPEPALLAAGLKQFWAQLRATGFDVRRIWNST